LAVIYRRIAIFGDIHNAAASLGATRQLGRLVTIWALVYSRRGTLPWRPPWRSTGIGAPFDPILPNIPLQLLAYRVALKKGCDIDQPRNLAKSVTVE